MLMEASESVELAQDNNDSYMYMLACIMEYKLNWELHQYRKVGT